MAPPEQPLANQSLPDHQVTVPIDRPLNLRTTLAPLTEHGDPTGRKRSDGVWKAMRTALGPATVRVRSSDDHHGVTLSAWGSGAEAAVTEAHQWLGLTDDPLAFDTSGHRLVTKLARQHPGMRLGRFGMVADRIVPAILGQKVIAAEAHQSYRRLTWKHGKPAPGPLKLPMPIEPAALARLPHHEWHAVGVERKRADIITRVSRLAPKLDRLMDVPLSDAYDFLTAIPGIGPWTSAVVGQPAFGDPDVVLLGDYNLPHLVSWALAGQRRGTDEQMLELLEPFRGNRARVIRLLKMSGNSPPRHGPKLGFRSVEQH